MEILMPFFSCSAAKDNMMPVLAEVQKLLVAATVVLNQIIVLLVHLDLLEALEKRELMDNLVCPATMD